MSTCEAADQRIQALHLLLNSETQHSGRSGGRSAASFLWALARLEAGLLGGTKGGSPRGGQ